MSAQISFRGLLTLLDDRRQLRHVSRRVDARHELVAIMRKVQKGPNQPLLFATVNGSPTPIATNILCRRSILADSLNLPLAGLLPELVKREFEHTPARRRFGRSRP